MGENVDICRKPPADFIETVVSFVFVMNMGRSIKFNATKCKCLAVVSRKRHWLSFQLDFCQFQAIMSIVSSFVHLGRIITF